MSSSFFRPFYFLLILLCLSILLITCFFIPSISSFPNSLEILDYFEISASGFTWPTPGYTTITSYFGKRFSPTAGATSYHKGIDIGAPENTKLVAVVDGTITYTGFLGGGRLYHYSLSF